MPKTMLWAKAICPSRNMPDADFVRISEKSGWLGRMQIGRRRVMSLVS